MKPLSRKVKNGIMIIAFAALLFVSALTPLAPEAEVMTRLIADAIGIDVTEEGVVVTAETMNSGTSEVVMGKGGILTEALQNIDERYGRKLELGHCGLIVLGASLDREDMVSVFMSILSDATVNAGCSVVAAVGEARKIIEDTQNLTESTNDGLTGYVTFADERLAVTVPSVLEFAQDINSASAAGVLPIVDIVKREVEGGGQGGSSGGGESQSGAGEEAQSKQQGGEEKEIVPPKSHRVIGSEIFEIDETDSNGLIWLQDRTRDGMMTTELDIGGRKYTIRGIIDDKKSGIEGKFAAAPEITVSVDAKLRLVDRYSVLAEVEKGVSLAEITAKISDSFRATIEREVAKIAELSRSVDFLGYKTVLFRSDAKLYRAWGGDMSGVKIGYNIKTTIL